jgi:hypothetical protein
MTRTAGALGADADKAAGLLTAVGRLSTASSSTTAVDLGVPLRCLLAADGLRAAGALPADVAQLIDDPDAIAAAIRTALDLLAGLPAEVFSRDLVADAAADARAALTTLT